MQFVSDILCSHYQNLCIVINISISGSITVTFVIDGNLTDVNSTAYSLCETISNSTSYMFDGYTLTLDSYMTIDNQTFYGVECGTVVSVNLNNCIFGHGLTGVWFN